MASHNRNFITCPHCGNDTKSHAIHFEDAPQGISSAMVRNWFLLQRKHHVATHVCEHCHNLIDLSIRGWPTIYYLWLVLLSAIGSASLIVIFLCFTST